MKEPRKSRRKWLLLIPVILVALFLGLLVLDTWSDKNSAYTYLTEKSLYSDYQLWRNDEGGAVEQDPELLANMRRLGLKDFDDLKVVSANNGEEMSKECYENTDHIDANACYSPKKIVIRKDKTAEEVDTSIAHEFLHYQWSKDRLGNNRQLTSDLMVLYGNNEVLRGYLSYYSDSGTLDPEEVFANICTKAKDSALTKHVLDTCNKYIDRSRLTLTLD